MDILKNILKLITVVINIALYYAMFQELNDALIVTKFVLRYFDTWMWIIPKELMNCNTREFSKSYNFYYHR